MGTKEEVLEGLYQKGFMFERNNHGCGQCTVAAIQEFFDVDDLIFKSASAYAGGIASVTNGYCGAFNGGVLILNYFFGREKKDFENPDAMDKAKEIVNIYKDRFFQKFGGFTCGQVQTKIMGRSFNTADPEEKEQFIQAGAYDDKCTNVVGTAASIVGEILLDNNIPLKKG
ncbi:MAG: C-GCAxxG-C-C family protein [Bacillota bacterium]|nr:C-GCAxxG-C-C family protein [Bacillota bacterium]